MHMAIRHRNLLALHSDLLSAHTPGLRNVFTVTGDVPLTGDYPYATAAHHRADLPRPFDNSNTLEISTSSYPTRHLWCRRPQPRAAHQPDLRSLQLSGPYFTPKCT